MKYRTVNEFNHFIYGDAQLGDIEVTSGFVHLWMDNVGISEECSANRDIRTMRCNGMLFRVEEMRIEEVVEEGYRYYDADGRLMREDPDRKVDPEAYANVFESLRGGYVISFEKKPLEDGRFEYIMAADSSDEKTYDLILSGSGDVQEWDRFLSPGAEF